jgi:hypothetical protein
MGEAHEPHSTSRGSPRRQSVPGVERLEDRDLPSVAPIFSAHVARAVPVPNPATILQAQVQPTPHEVDRQNFVAKFSGTYVTGPGRFTDQSAQIQLVGSGGSNWSLHMYVLGAVFFPTDPAASAIGLATLYPKNMAQTGDVAIP